MGDNFGGRVVVKLPARRDGFNPLSACDVGIVAVRQKRGNELWWNVEKDVGMDPLEKVVGQERLERVGVIARSL